MIKENGVPTNESAVCKHGKQKNEFQCTSCLSELISKLSKAKYSPLIAETELNELINGIGIAVNQPNAAEAIKKLTAIDERFITRAFDLAHASQDKKVMQNMLAFLELRYPDPDDYDISKINFLLKLKEYSRMAKFFNQSNPHLMFDPLEPFFLKKFLPKRDAWLKQYGDLKPSGDFGYIDFFAIKNLLKNFDITVPIANGGLKQGFIAHLFGAQTKIIDVSAHDQAQPTFEWLDPVSENDFKDKDVLLFDKDAISGATIRLVYEVIKKFKPKSISVYFKHPINTKPYHKKNNYFGTFTQNLPPDVTIYTSRSCNIQGAPETYLELLSLLEITDHDDEDEKHAQELKK